MDQNNEVNVNENDVQTTEMSGLTATMEVAGVESIPNVKTDKVVLGYSRD